MSDPRVAELAARYSETAADYDTLWSPIIRPMSAQLFDAITCPPAPLVLDVGCGTGVMAEEVRARHPEATVAGVDIAEGMVARAVAAGRERAVAGSATAIPFAFRSFDLVFSVFVLQHVPDPLAAIAQMGDVARAGGIGATVTWGPMKDSYAEDVLEEMLTAAGAPKQDRAIDTAGLLDDEDKVATAWRDAGLSIERTWSRQVEHPWTIDSLLEVVTGYGRAKMRFQQLSPQAQESFMTAARERLAAMAPDELTWRPGVVFAIARR